jgi:pSer/pThr/pTyr-binding forkhead associated (FHA) protein
MSDKPLAHDCRKCSNRQRMLCIDQAPISPDDKLKIWQAFSAHRATEEIQRLLQLQCALDQVAAEQGRGKQPLSEAQGRQEEKVAAKGAPGQHSLSALRGRGAHLHTRPLRIGEEEALAARPIEAARPAVLKGDLAGEKSEEQERVEEPPTPSCVLVALSTGHRIALPSQGAITLGRVDVEFGSMPDVDLTQEAKAQRSSISRFHAKISLDKGRYYIEDLGSTNGTMVNGQPVDLGEKVPIRTGDRVSLGLCEMMCYATSRWLSREVGQRIRAYLMVTFNGYRYYIPDKREVILGRSESGKRHVVDINLVQQGKVASVVSRRHARLTRQAGLDFLEDLGSTYGTRLNGTEVKDEMVPLAPGDHIWLGGCVLCYDHEVSSREAGE